jgi:ABC-type sugar transport system permease subunit
MTHGGPGYATQTLVLTIYQIAFKQNKMGFATAMSIFMLVIVLLVTLLQRKAYKKGDLE